MSCFKKTRLPPPPIFLRGGPRVEYSKVETPLKKGLISVPDFKLRIHIRTHIKTISSYFCINTITHPTIGLACNLFHRNLYPKLLYVLFIIEN